MIIIGRTNLYILDVAIYCENNRFSWCIFWLESSIVSPESCAPPPCSE